MSLTSATRLLVAAVLAVTLGFAGCTSNPTPHPGQGGGGEYADVVDGHSNPEPTDQKEPDRDDNGVGDCTQAGGVWHAGECEGATLRPGDTNGFVDNDAKTPDDASDADDATHEDDADDANDAEDVKDAGDAKPPDEPSSEGAGQ